jgi:hypothetical protein
LGHEPDADQRIDAQAQARGTACRIEATAIASTLSCSARDIFSTRSLFCSGVPAELFTAIWKVFVCATD